MKTQILFAVSVLLVGILSCKKDKTWTAEQTDLTKLSDSCSYTLDGVPFICNQLYSGGGGNAGANLDTSNGGWEWDADSLQYHVKFSINAVNLIGGGYPGDLTVRFVKKFAKSQLTRAITGSIFGPASDTLLYYPKGEQGYAVDYSRFNSQNGVVLEIATESIGNVRQIISTYSSEMVHLPTTIANDSQKNSTFNITNIYFVPAYGGWLDSHILEAKFEAVLFDGNENPHYLKNGYIRIHV